VVPGNGLTPFITDITEYVEIGDDNIRIMKPAAYQETTALPHQFARVMVMSGNRHVIYIIIRYNFPRGLYE
jgi:hypothetical protein